MKIINSSDELKSMNFKNPSALIPTMGNLHEGHLSLVNYGRKNYPEHLEKFFKIITRLVVELQTLDTRRDNGH